MEIYCNILANCSFLWIFCNCKVLEDIWISASCDICLLLHIVLHVVVFTGRAAITIAIALFPMAMTAVIMAVTLLVFFPIMAVASMMFLVFMAMAFTFFSTIAFVLMVAVAFMLFFLRFFLLGFKLLVLERLALTVVEERHSQSAFNFFQRVNYRIECSQSKHYEQNSLNLRLSQSHNTICEHNCL